jgi:hypothetical protein
MGLFTKTAKKTKKKPPAYRTLTGGFLEKVGLDEWVIRYTKHELADRE